MQQLVDDVNAMHLLEGCDPETPLFAALKEATGAGLADARWTSRVQARKKAFVILWRARSKFAAMRTAMSIAEMYVSREKSSSARKFLQLALDIARDLKNNYYEQVISQRLEQIGDERSRYTGLVASFHAISRVLLCIDSYPDAIDQLIKFALQETGAERAVLLLRNEQNGMLYAESSVNVDDDSGRDIVDFSNRMPLEAMQSDAPLVIDNAVNDKRTKNYKSVAVHNILSVTCVPLKQGEERVGILYLDHHSIPALFTKHDVQYISGIANFLSSMLIALRRYKTQRLSNIQLREELRQVGKGGEFLTRNRTVLNLLEKLPDVARSDVPVLIVGESGTGKEIISRRIHELSRRSSGPFAKINCAAIASGLAEAEIFGIADKVATGVRGRRGKLAAADGGTLFLDEIGDLSKDIQAKILHVVEYDQYEKVGSNVIEHSDVRFVYATNRDLIEMVDEGKFRADLFHRISTITIKIPPLRERLDDVLLLMDHFLALADDTNARPSFTSEAINAMLAYPWPGNVRELKNVVDRCRILYAGQSVTKSMLPPAICNTSSFQHVVPKVTIEAQEALRIRRALDATRGNQSQAARTIGIPLSTFRRRMKKYGII
jgi:transcriptional regulator with GAF, ATPase, and Fis domain